MAFVIMTRCPSCKEIIDEENFYGAIKATAKLNIFETGIECPNCGWVGVYETYGFYAWRADLEEIAEKLDAMVEINRGKKT